MRKLAAWLLLAGLLGLGAWWLRQPVPPDAAPDAARAAPSPPARQESQPDAPAVVATTAPRRTATHAPLPDPSVPLRDAFAALDARARAGDARAACRLAAELDTCAAVIDTLRTTNPIERRLELIANSSMPRAEKDAHIARARAEALQLQQRAAHCEGIDPAAQPPAVRYLAVAARAGHAPSRLLYLNSVGLTPSALLRDPGLGADYRLNAPMLFRQAIEEGDASVLLPWFIAAINPDATPLAVVLPDEFRAPGLVRALHAQLVASGRRDVPPLTERVGRRAEAPTEEETRAAQALFDRHFRTSPDRGPMALADYLGGEGARHCDEIEDG